MDVRTIVTEWLKEHGYDGLYVPGVCGCPIDDLMCCEAPSITAQTAADLAAIWAEDCVGCAAYTVLKEMEKAVRGTPSLWPEIERALNALCARIEEEMDDE